MDSGTLVLRSEHLTPHDLVTYSRCPFEMEVLRARRESLHSPDARAGVHALRCRARAALSCLSPPLVHLVANDGRLDLMPHDTLVYVDAGEDDLPVLFAPEQVRPDARLQAHAGNLVDDELGLSGRPDYIVRRADGSLYPIEYKATHLFTGHHESHGRAFDAIQAIAECRLVHAATGVRPTHGVVLYGDVAGDGQHEGWVEVPYGTSEEHWLKAALTQIRTDRVRPPVPAERNCSGCEANRDGLCRFAASRYDGPHRAQGFHPTFR